ncbi:hypothetical protein MMC13_002209 [Lambiella insularis]|nr:hypothetical protein [Lambiella insularis]
MAPQILHRVIHGTTTPSALQSSFLTIKPAILHGYRRHKVSACDYPAIIPSHAGDPSHTVRGAFVTGLTAADIFRLDAFEGEEYVRRKVRVEVLGGSGGEEEGEEVEAETYVWVDGEEMLEEGEWRFETFVREKLGRWVGGKEYSKVDEAARGLEGIDLTGGRGVVEREVVRSAV